MVSRMIQPNRRHCQRNRRQESAKQDGFTFSVPLINNSRLRNGLQLTEFLSKTNRGLCRGRRRTKERGSVTLPRTHPQRTLTTVKTSPEAEETQVTHAREAREESPLLNDATADGRQSELNRNLQYSISSFLSTSSSTQACSACLDKPVRTLSHNLLMTWCRRTGHSASVWLTPSVSEERRTGECSSSDFLLFEDMMSDR